MKIRFYEKKYEGGSIPAAKTATFNEDGTPKPYFKIAVCDKDGNFYTNWQMLNKLKQSVWPDRPLSSLWPTLPTLPPKTYKVMEFIDGGYHLKTYDNPEYPIIKAEYDALVESFKNAFKVEYPEYNFCIIQQFWFPIIPGGEDWVWELVDDTKPYHNGRFTKIESVDGLYNGAKWMVVDDFNSDIIQGLVSQLYLSTPLKGMKVLSGVK